MYKLYVFFLVVFLIGETTSMRIKRQSRNETTTAEPEAAQVQPVSPSSSTPTENGQNTQSESDLQECIRSCPVTSEYNPVCGSNRVTYSNPGRLLCAQECGVNVSQLRTSPC
ncbi:unnamed protein product [Parnassius apollo]|uniref:(apollo) hypothetical protein n=1 Tax=Parnassius apollo TaxID=110799 RepID=A0A8S3WSY4_PARAO|nr:unnamed protein product [Parnassius apollo]